MLPSDSALGRQQNVVTAICIVNAARMIGSARADWRSLVIMDLFALVIRAEVEKCADDLTSS